jgi:hypothetical protein
MVATTAASTPPIMNGGIPVYSLPDYFGSYSRVEKTIRFYKYNSSTCKITACKPAEGPVIFTQNVSRRWIKYSPSYIVNNKSYRIGKINMGSKDYIVYIFASTICSYLKKHRNIVTLTDPTQLNWEAISAIIPSLGIFPEWTEPASAAPQQGPHGNTIRMFAPLKVPPAYVVDLMVNDAIAKGEVCPILYEPLTKENAVVTSCFHIFCRGGFTEWRKKSSECPKCREKCCVTS